MHCYKCGEKDVDKLSLKKQQRGVMTFVCRGCRNSAARIWKAKHSPLRQDYTDIDIVQWERWARESRERIAANYEARRVIQ